MPSSRLLRRAAWTCSLGLIVLASVQVAAWAQSHSAPTLPGARVVLDESAVLGYAEALFREGQYFRAISEYHRLQHYFPDSAHVPGARLRIAEASINGGSPEDAVEMLTHWLEAPEMASWRGEVLYLRAVARLEERARGPYSEREESIAAGLADLRALPPAWYGAARAREFAAAVEQQEELPYRAPWLAGLLSILLPGAGSVYADSPGRGMVALAGNGLLIAGAAESLQLGQNALAGALGATALVAYGITIQTAYEGASAFNDTQRAVHLDRLRATYGLEVRQEGLPRLFDEHD